MKTSRQVEALLSRRRLRPAEALPWALMVGVFFWAPEYLPFGAQIFVMILFALSLDLVVGYVGVVILGHAAFFGAGAYAAGLLAIAGWNEPITVLFLAGLVAGILGASTGVVILRTSGLGLLMLGMVVGLLLVQVANRWSEITGGFDGLRNVEFSPILGRFQFDFFGETAYVFSAGVLFLAWLLVREIVTAPFGQSLTGIRENASRMEALGAPVFRRKLIAFTVSAALAGVAGALATETTGFVGLHVLSLELSGAVLVMLVLGGSGRLYGAFVGVTVYMIAQDSLAKGDPVYWNFWLGAILILVVLFARGGILGIWDHGFRRLRAAIPRFSDDGRHV
jgi:branched-chain amino acid transport system permease protein